jgi:hypothetical protein
MSMKLSLVLGANKFELYTNSHARDIKNITQTEFDNTFSTNEYMLSQKSSINNVFAYRSSYNYWGITQPMIINLKNLLYQYLSSTTQSAHWFLELNLEQSYKSS